MHADDRENLIGRVRRVLSAKRVPKRLSMLVADLFTHANLEDVAVYKPEEIADFVRSADSLLAKRKPGQHVIRLTDPKPSDDDSPLAGVTLVEVLNDNMPFLVDSVMGEIQDFGATIRLVAHPIVTVERSRDGKLTEYRGTTPPEQGDKAIRESLIQVHIDRLLIDSERKKLQSQLDTLLRQVRSAVVDWRAMLERLSEAIAAYMAEPPPIPSEEVSEAIAFLEWLVDENFTFLGLREYDYVGGKLRGRLSRSSKPGLGILSDPDVRVLRRGTELVTMTPEIRRFLMRPAPLIIAKANVKSKIHRRTYLDYVGVKLYGRDGRLAGELRLVGLFTSTAYTRSTRAIPILRRKVDSIFSRAGYDPSSHSGKALLNVLEAYPRDELFQVDEETLYEFALAILALEERPRVRVLARRDEFDRFVSVIVFVPRDRYDSHVRIRIGDYLKSVYDGRLSAYYPAFPEGPLARVHFIIGRFGGETPNPDQTVLEQAVESIVKTWADRLEEALHEGHDVRAAFDLDARYGQAFPASYRDDFDADIAVRDIGHFETLAPERPIAIEFHRRDGADEDGVYLKLVHRQTPIALSERVPMLENMGFRVIDERTYEILPGDERPPLYLHDMALERADGERVDLKALAGLLTDCFLAIWNGQAESDGYNALTVAKGLGWRDVATLRAISRYLHQIGSPHSQDYMWATLNRHADIAAAIVALFHARFDPKNVDEGAAEAATEQIETALDDVKSLDEDRIIRRFVNVVEAMVRTNAFQHDADGELRTEISFKLDSKRIDGLPAPRPFREIFVYSPRVEGVHLRFGEVARGGIRWSDRPQDFRTEILGLAKAQQVKNAVIVPFGAKGGFVPKRLPVGGGRDAIFAEGTEAYRIFISSLLDITDNLDGETVVPPEEAVRHESDDPYLVVAADKGTATFSDTANEISETHHYWLGDAFASGGSAGYDHKKMGITARGAWEAVKRHFREFDVDIQTTPFTVVGVGDMSGDVFGNGMLLSPAIKLIAAFDHRDIFIDPDPDPEKSLAERQRLFDMPRSSWQDYDRDKISAGGGVFSRQEKSIGLSREIRTLLDLPGERATPQELMQAILKARADLLWFGGIGTYVRAAEEGDDKVGDRANDAIRVTADALRVRVVGEGANLGMTQRARIAFGLKGGRCNSDAIDNSAGVNTSDIEVNIKIALGLAVRAGKLDVKRRNRLLRTMTEDVAALVLRNNYLQTLAISLSEERGFEDFGFQLRMMQGLETRGLLDRAVEVLPDDAAMAERQKASQPLTRAEIGVLLAYAKIVLFEDLLAADVADDRTLDAELIRYFPQRMHKDFRKEIEGHQLRGEIIATMLANSMINRGGPTYLTRVADRTGAGTAAIARAYTAVRDSFGLRAVNEAIDAIDTRIPGSLQLELYRAVQDLVLSRTVWFLRNASFAEGIGSIVEAYGKSIAAVGGMLDDVMPEQLRDRLAAAAGDYVEKGVPEDVARQVVRLPVLADAVDIHRVADELGAPLARAAKVFFAVGDHFRVGRIEMLASRLSVADYFDGLALDRALETLGLAHRRIAIAAIETGDEDPLAFWLEPRQAAVERVMRAIATMTEAEELSVSRVTVAANLLADLARG